MMSCDECGKTNINNPHLCDKCTREYTLVTMAFGRTKNGKKEKY